MFIYIIYIFNSQHEYKECVTSFYRNSGVDLCDSGAIIVAPSADMARSHGDVYKPNSDTCFDGGRCC